MGPACLPVELHPSGTVHALLSSLPLAVPRLQCLFSGSLIAALGSYALIILFGVFDEKATAQP